MRELKRLAGFGRQLVERKRAIFAGYAERMVDVPGVELNHEVAPTRSSYWMTTALMPREAHLGKDELVRRLAACGVSTRPMFRPLSSLPAFAESPDVARAKACNQVAYDVAPRGINLPSAATLTEAQADRVCSALEAALERRACAA